MLPKVSGNTCVQQSAVLSAYQLGPGLWKANSEGAVHKFLFQRIEQLEVHWELFGM